MIPTVYTAVAVFLSINILTQVGEKTLREIYRCRGLVSCLQKQTRKYKDERQWEGHSKGNHTRTWKLIVSPPPSLFPPFCFAVHWARLSKTRRDLARVTHLIWRWWLTLPEGKNAQFGPTPKNTRKQPATLIQKYVHVYISIASILFCVEGTRVDKWITAWERKKQNKSPARGVAKKI